MTERGDSVVLQALKDKFSGDAFKLDSRWGLLALAAAAAVLAVAVVYYMWRDQGPYRALHGAGESFPAADVMHVLDGESIKYRLHPQSGQVLVREDQLAQARMLLTAKGVQVAVPAGYELFDQEEPLGTSHFVQNVRLKRSLEGELARTVMAIKGVEQARVHLALQESSSFVVSKRDPAKASVMLQLAPGYKLNSEQVGAIINLVANSVGQLATSDVSVVDQHGALLSRGLNLSNKPVQNWQVVDDYQAKLVANVEEVLAPVLGRGNYRISVSADVDLSQREETFQTYGEVPHVRKEVLRDENVLDQLALGVPGSLANNPVRAPEEGADGDVQNKAATSVRTESNRQMDYDQTVTHVQHAPFAVRQQSIAVVLNTGSAPPGGWTPEARADLEDVVKSAVGFNQARGDLLTLKFFAFNDPTIPMAEVPWWEKNQVHDLAKIGIFGLVSLLLLLMVVRPALRSLVRSNEPSLLPPDDVRAVRLTDEEEGAPSNPALAGSTKAGQLSGMNPLAEIQLPDQGSGLELQIEHLQMLAINDSERVSEVIKQWVGRNQREAPSR